MASIRFGDEEAVHVMDRQMAGEGYREGAGGAIAPAMVLRSAVLPMIRLPIAPPAQGRRLERDGS